MALFLLRGEYLSPLLDGLFLWINVWMVLYDTSVYAWHVFMGLDKHIQTLFEERQEVICYC